MRRGSEGSQAGRLFFHRVRVHLGKIGEGRKEKWKERECRKYDRTEESLNRVHRKPHLAWARLPVGPPAPNGFCPSHRLGRMGMFQVPLVKQGHLVGPTKRPFSVTALPYAAASLEGWPVPSRGPPERLQGPESSPQAPGQDPSRLQHEVRWQWDFYRASAWLFFPLIG